MWKLNLVSQHAVVTSNQHTTTCFPSTPENLKLNYQIKHLKVDGLYKPEHTGNKVSTV